MVAMNPPVLLEFVPNKYVYLQYSILFVCWSISVTSHYLISHGIFLGHFNKTPSSRDLDIVLGHVVILNKKEILTFMQRLMLLV